MKKCMIVYASRTGTTENCAQLLAKKFPQAELYDLAYGIPYVLDCDTVIVGSYVHAGNISRRVKQFLVKNREALLHVHLGLYICNAVLAQADAILQWNFPRDLLQHAVCISTFGGELHIEQLHGLQRMMVRRMRTVDAQRSADEPHLLPHIIEEFAYRLLLAETAGSADKI